MPIIIPSKGATASWLLSIGSNSRDFASSPMQRDALPKAGLLLLAVLSKCNSKLTPGPLAMCMTAGWEAEEMIAMKRATESCT